MRRILWKRLLSIPLLSKLLRMKFDNISEVLYFQEILQYDNFLYHSVNNCSSKRYIFLHFCMLVFQKIFFFQWWYSLIKHHAPFIPFFTITTIQVVNGPHHLHLFSLDIVSKYLRFFLQNETYFVKFYRNTCKDVS